jgi:DNA-binding NtrC family response regulator
MKVAAAGIEIPSLYPQTMIGQSPVFLAVMRQIEQVARYDVPVLIEGETGTGKELAARAIHYGSARRDRAFIPINCGALPEMLIENELFGHCRGAFTDARNDWPGLLRVAHRGTLFLDEVDAMPSKGQVALLRFLQDNRFRPLGGATEGEADVRVIAAANRSLEELAARGEFRLDLLFRLKLIFIELPPLRLRTGDAPLLAEHFVKKCAARYGGPLKQLHSNSRDWFAHYRWPGNVRELENLVHRECLLNDCMEICGEPPCGHAPATGGASLTAGRIEFDDKVAYAVARTRAVEAFDRAYLAGLIARTKGNVTQAAKIAGKERRALGKLLKKYHIEAAPFRVATR